MDELTTLGAADDVAAAQGLLDQMGLLDQLAPVEGEPARSLADQVDDFGQIHDKLRSALDDAALDDARGE